MDAIREFNELVLRDVDVAYGSTVWLPHLVDIPEQFKEFTAEPPSWLSFVSNVFYEGAPGLQYITQDGVLDPGKVYAFLMSHLCSFQPKHEHKIAGIAYRLSQILVGARIQGPDGPIIFGDWPEEN